MTKSKSIKKYPQKIRGCFFPEHKIPNTFEEFKGAYYDNSVYAGFKKGKERTEQMEKDYETLTNVKVRQADKSEQGTGED